MEKPKIVVAYSGGLDTSVMVKWLHEKFNADVITATGDLGQKKELEGVQAEGLCHGGGQGVHQGPERGISRGIRLSRAQGRRAV